LAKPPAAHFQAQNLIRVVAAMEKYASLTVKIIPGILFASLRETSPEIWRF